MTTHSMAKANLNKSKKVLTSTTTASKYKTQEAQNLYQLKSPFSDLTSKKFQKLFSLSKSCFTMFTFRGTVNLGLKGEILIDADSGMYFDAVVVEVKKNLLLFILALAILCCINIL